MKKRHNMNVKEYIKQVIFPVLLVSAISIVFAVSFKMLLGNGIWQSLVEIAGCLFATGVFVYIFGMTKTEKKHFLHFFLNNKA